MSDAPLLPEHILKRMDPADRASLGKAGRTAQEAAQDGARRLERHRHDVYIQWLHLRSIPFIHANPTKPSTIESGWPDFTLLWQGAAFCLEFKTETGVLSAKQEVVIARLTAAGVFVAVVTEAGEAIRLTQQRFKLPGALPEAS